ncbi:unnamed protein product [Linum tenue]|uniref:RING-type domain-containing protein n=1 Tax=Linum tenue TaxID=586396 RepID=A0AAV0NBT3_9ROSI|nr:unnamed protein product [Linum tenue]
MVLAFLKWGWDLLFHLSFFHHRYHDYYYYHHPAQRRVQEYYDSNDVVVAGAAGSSEESPECAVCLSKVEEGDQVRELSCRHVFHRVCLDRWCQSSFTRRCPTCPLCRRSLTTTPATCRGSSAAAEPPEVLLFDFASFVSSDRDTRDTWWLR